MKIIIPNKTSIYSVNLFLLYSIYLFLFCPLVAPQTVDIISTMLISLKRISFRLQIFPSDQTFFKNKFFSKLNYYDQSDINVMSNL